MPLPSQTSLQSLATTKLVTLFLSKIGFIRLKLFFSLNDDASYNIIHEKEIFNLTNAISFC